jgi:UDP-N-acetylglucosamine--N-acetylmuramyl-(pentapeptide) pyrophosphoryl-undecaprenol N-acetylglucosamine transferase
MPQTELTPRALADLLHSLQRTELLDKARKAKTLQQCDATAKVVAACEELSS